MRAYIVREPDGEFQSTEHTWTESSGGQSLRERANPLDTKIRAGKAAHAKQPLPAVLELDMAGTIKEVGPDMARFNLEYFPRIHGDYDPTSDSTRQLAT